jgi:uncharacterized membrane protein (UPF0127 family)
MPSKAMPALPAWPFCFAGAAVSICSVLARPSKTVPRIATTNLTGKRLTVTRPGGGVLCEQCSLAQSAFTRMRGLLGRRALPHGEGLLLRPAGSIHTAFMRFAIDAVFLDRELTVLAIEPNVPPWRTARSRGAKAVLELPAGECARRRLAVGERLELSG